MQNQATPTARAHARSLRAGMADSERKLWRGLRMEQLGAKFRRQHPLGRYIADFACLDPKIIIELDGSQHADDAAYDARRDAYMKSQGFDVLRFATDKPLRNLEGVLSVIFDRVNLLRGLPPSQPSPKGGRSELPRKQA